MSTLVLRATSNTCGSGLARDGDPTGDIDVECANVIAGKPAPTGFSTGHKVVIDAVLNVGASLLAIVVCQATSMLNVPAASRAGSLPQTCTFQSSTRRSLPLNGAMSF
ncbi:hypothetical protein J3D54_004342 [Pseudomonas sp. GGS8]|uniref:hypothetical protein n=1 Tax=Pseudomonas sp. GGS8 TaxID=2817892 RepID=UPI00209DA3A7|nr:hypothetical protein [Pseudomonas sp. GGS8]MCP1445210.1 hypothetical protein [Pseudomonas sp. GGS8]